MTEPFNEAAMAGIEHVVVLMLENRSLDSLLGWLYEHDAPAHNIPALKAGERTYEGLQGLDLDSYINGSAVPLKQDIDLSLSGVLRAGKWTAGQILSQDATQQRAAVVQQLVKHSSEQAEAFAGKTDDELVGMAGAILFLQGSGTKTFSELHAMTTDDHRNTLITTVATIEKDKGRPLDFEVIVKELQGESTKDIVEAATRGQAWVRLRIPPIRGSNALNAPNFSPGESYGEVVRQQYGIGGDVHQPPKMRGFVTDYVHVLQKDRGCSDEQVINYADQVMRSYTPAQLPVLNSLAKHYAVCDMWFSSVPSQTNPNRAFTFCGTSAGMVDNGYLEEDEHRHAVEKLLGFKLGDDRVHAKTIFNALAEDGNSSWKIYYRCGMLQENIKTLIDIYRGQAPAVAALAVAVPWILWPLIALEVLTAAFLTLVEGLDDDTLDYMRGLSDGSVDSAYSYRLFPELRSIPDSKSNVEPFEKFHEAARAGTLPNFTFIEPVWSISPRSTGSSLGGNVLYHLGDDYHPPCNLDGSENLVQRVYESLISNTDAWNKTLFIITFDEPVGAFDHVSPPKTTPPWGEGPPPQKNEAGFNFDRLGARVPTLLISPLIEKGTVFRSSSDTPFDHTSLIATVLNWRKRADKVTEFGERTRRAPTFESVVTRTRPREDAKSLPFLQNTHKLGDPVHYFDRFCLRNEDGRALSPFKEALAEGAVWGAALWEKDAALTEFFPTMTDNDAKKSKLYCVNPDDRIDDRTITRYIGTGIAPDTSYVKLLALDSGLMSYNVLGVWQDSRDCYYSNDYIEGELDQKERWRIVRPDDDHESPNDPSLRYGQQILIESERYPGWYLAPDGEWVRTSKYNQKWTVLPVDEPIGPSSATNVRGDAVWMAHFPNWHINGAVTGPDGFLLFDPTTRDWWLSSATVAWTPLGNGSESFGGAPTGCPTWLADFTGTGQSQVLFFNPGDQNWWLGTVAGINGVGPPTITWKEAGNTSGFGDIAKNPFWIGDFAGAGKSDLLFYSLGDQNWWLGTFDGPNLKWALVGNTEGFGSLASHPTWIGKFTDAGKSQVLFFSPFDNNWWLGTVDGPNLTWAPAGDTKGFGNIGRNPFWIGDFTGFGKSQVLFYSLGDHNWWLGTFNGPTLSWALAGNTSGFGDTGSNPTWISDFAGVGKSQVLFCSPGDGNWWLGSFGGPFNDPKLSWAPAGNTMGFGDITSGPIWMGDFNHSGHTGISFFALGNGEWSVGTLSDGKLQWQITGNGVPIPPG